MSTQFPSRLHRGPRRQHGQMIYGVILGLVIVAAGIFFVVRYFNQGSSSQLASQQAAAFTVAIGKTQGLFKTSPDFSGLDTNGIQDLAQNGVFPRDAVSSDGSTVTSLFGTPITVKSASVYGGAADGATFTLNVPVAACSEFAADIATSVAQVGVGSGDLNNVYDSTSTNNGLNQSALGQACSQGTNGFDTINLTFGKA